MNRLAAILSLTLVTTSANAIINPPSRYTTLAQDVLDLVRERIKNNPSLKPDSTGTYSQIFGDACIYAGRDFTAFHFLTDEGIGYLHDHQSDGTLDSMVVVHGFTSLSTLKELVSGKSWLPFTKERSAPYSNCQLYRVTATGVTHFDFANTVVEEVGFKKKLQQRYEELLLRFEKDIELPL
jgi:hypothetical protein